MSPSQVLVIVTFAAGGLMLLGWMRLTASNARSMRILVKSVPLMVLPGAILCLLSQKIALLPYSAWALVFVEEGIKAFASRTEKAPIDRFWLVSLFGVWELMLAKPFYWITNPVALSGWNQTQPLGMTVVEMVPVLMHVVTAAIYAFHFRERPWLAFLASWGVHAAFNKSILFGLSPLASGGRIVALAALLLVLWPNRPPLRLAGRSS